MDIQKILEVYQLGQKGDSPHWLLADGSVVLGEEVDEDNKLHYVIQRGDTITIEYAGSCRVVEDLKPKKSETIVLTGKKISLP